MIRKGSAKKDFPYFGNLWKSVLVFLLTVSVLPLAGVAVAMYGYAARAATQKSSRFVKVEAGYQKAALDACLSGRIQMLDMVLTPLARDDASSAVAGLLLLQVKAGDAAPNGLAIYDDKGDLASAAGSIDHSPQAARAPWFAAVMEKQLHVGSEMARAGASVPFFISLRMPGPSGPLAVRAAYDAAVLTTAAFSMAEPSLSSGVLLDASGAPLAGNAPVPAQICPLPSDRFKGVRLVRHENGLCAFAHLEKADWMVRVQMENQAILGGLRTVRNVGIFVLVFAAILIVGTIFDVTNYLVGRLEQKRQKIHILDHQLRHAGRAVTSLHYITEMTAEMKDIFNNIDLTAKWMKERIKSAEKGGDGELLESIDQIHAQLQRAGRGGGNGPGFHRGPAAGHLPFPCPRGPGPGRGLF